MRAGHPAPAVTALTDTVQQLLTEARRLLENLPPAPSGNRVHVAVFSDGSPLPSAEGAPGVLVEPAPVAASAPVVSEPVTASAAGPDEAGSPDVASVRPYREPGPMELPYTRRVVNKVIG